MTNYHDNKVSSFSNAMKWGSYTAGALIVFDLLLYLTGMKDPGGQNPIQYLGFILFIAMIVMGIKAMKDSNGSLSLGEGIGTGVLSGLIAGILVGVYIYIFMSFIDPGFIQSMQDAMRDKMLADGMTEAQYEQAEGMMNMITSPGMMAASSVMTYGFLSLIISLIASLVLRNNN